MKKYLVTVLLSVFCIAAAAQTANTVSVAEAPDGEFVQKNNSIKIYGNVLAGQKTGTWTETYSNTELPHYIIQYLNDKQDGIFIEFDKQGNLVRKIDYKNGLMDGRYYKFKNTVLLELVEYQEGKKNGASTLYYDDGFIMESSNFKNGQRDGVTEWYAHRLKEQGEMVAKYTYQDGRFEGLQETFFENGAVKTRKMYANNVQDGPAFEFYEDGSVKTEATFKKGEIKGKQKEYQQGKKILK